jgi:hypothetical protein
MSYAATVLASKAAFRGSGVMSYAATVLASKAAFRGARVSLSHADS